MIKGTKYKRLELKWNKITNNVDFTKLKTGEPGRII